jgi:uncharacterized oligopeptide transporter (OPT) family protein
MRKQRGNDKGAAEGASRVERDLPMITVVFGSLLIIAMMWGLLTFKPIAGAETGLFANLVAGIFVVVFGFLFVTVSSRICGLIGTSANPVSGMTIATLMATCATFLVMGWTAGAYGALAITIGGVVCIASANAGATSQDLKTGFLVGATPRSQQIGLMIGVLASAFAIGGTLMLMNRGLAQYKDMQLPLDITRVESKSMDGVQIETQSYTHKGKTYVLVNAIGSKDLPDGKYLYDPATRQIEIQWVQGIGSDKAAAPQARLMATVISGILNQRLPWRLVLLGVFLVCAVELLGIRSLSFAVGSYLGLHTTCAIFIGGIVRWLAERGQKPAGGHAESEVSPGSLYASGLIAAGGVVGLLAIVLNVLGDPELMKTPLLDPAKLAFGPKLVGASAAQGNALAVLMFAALAATLFVFARKKLE